MLIISILVIGVLVHACLNYKFTVAYASIMFALVFLWDGSLPNVESFSTKNLVSIAISTTIFMILYLNKRNRDQLNRRKAHFRNADDVNLYPNAEVPTSHELMIAHDCEQKTTQAIIIRKFAPQIAIDWIETKHSFHLLTTVERVLTKNTTVFYVISGSALPVQTSKQTVLLRSY